MVLIIPNSVDYRKMLTIIMGTAGNELILKWNYEECTLREDNVIFRYFQIKSYYT